MSTGFNRQFLRGFGSDNAQMPKGAQADTAGLALYLAVSGQFTYTRRIRRCKTLAVPAEQVADMYVPNSYGQVSLAARCLGGKNA